jgi:hypothetical protein
MMRHLVIAAASVGALGVAGLAHAADVVKARPGAVAAPVFVVPDCSVFFDDYRRRGFTWGSGPGTSVGLGTFEGALPRYPDNSFPNWYGQCAEWGNYSSAGSITRW